MYSPTLKGFVTGSKMFIVLALDIYSIVNVN